MTLSNTLYFIGGVAVTALALATGASTKNQQQSLEEYSTRVDQAPVFLDLELAAETKAFMKRSMEAHHNRDAMAEVAELGDPYSFTMVLKDGPVQLASSREMAKAVSINLYESDYMKNYQGVESQPIAIIGNIGIQFDIETFEFEDGTQKVNKILTVYETKDGKLWRNWAFYPLTGEG